MSKRLLEETRSLRMAPAVLVIWGPRSFPDTHFPYKVKEAGRTQTVRTCVVKLLIHS